MIDGNTAALNAYEIRQMAIDNLEPIIDVRALEIATLNCDDELFREAIIEHVDLDALMQLVQNILLDVDSARIPAAFIDDINNISIEHFGGRATTEIMSETHA